ncbi:MAG: tetratricopeptide repeat protein [Euryarchaeota archaeon]
MDEWIDKGAALYALGRYQEEVQCLNKALEIDPLNDWAQSNLRVGNR